MLIELLLYVSAACSGDKDCYVIANPTERSSYLLMICEDIPEPYIVDFFASGGDTIHIETHHKPRDLCEPDTYPPDGLYEQNRRWRDEDSDS